MVAVSRQRLDSFTEMYSGEGFLREAYGQGDQSAGREALESDLEVMVLMIEIWGQVAAFGADWFKRTLIECGAFAVTLDLLHVLKLMVDTLDKMGIFE